MPNPSLLQDSFAIIPPNDLFGHLELPQITLQNSIKHIKKLSFIQVYIFFWVAQFFELFSYFFVPFKTFPNRIKFFPENKGKNIYW
jgi:hypothetical protein